MLYCDDKSKVFVNQIFACQRTIETQGWLVVKCIPILSHGDLKAWIANEQFFSSFRGLVVSRK
jgi:hypothetical protein